MDYQVISLEEAPVSINEWLEENQDIENHIIMKEAERIYVVVTMGEKNTGGYDIELLSVSETEDKIFVHVQYFQPEHEMIVIQTITYPTIIIELEKTEKEIVLLINK